MKKKRSKFKKGRKSTSVHGFKYKRRSKEQVKKRADQSGGVFDSIIKDRFSMLVLKEDDYQLRIMPPTWDDADHFGLDVFVHYGVGADSQTYLCLNKMKDETCPVCEEKKRAEAEGEIEYSKELTATKRVGVWVINRKNTEDGPLIWTMPWTIDRDLAELMIDKHSGEILLIDNPEDGYDIEFTKKGSGLKTKYSGLQIARRSSPLDNDPDQAREWLEYINDNPISDTLNYFDEEYIENVCAGGKTEEEEEEEEDEEEEDEENVPTKGELKKMDHDELEEVAQNLGLDVDTSDYPDSTSGTKKLRNAIIEVIEEEIKEEDEGEDEEENEENGEEEEEEGEEENGEEEEKEDEEDEEEEEEEEEPKKRKPSARKNTVRKKLKELSKKGRKNRKKRKSRT